MKINNKIIRLFSNRGFYILLALGVGIVSVTGYVANLKNKTSYKVPATSFISESETVPKLPSMPAVFSEDEAITPAPKGVAAAATMNLQRDTTLILPLQGELGTGFSADELVFSKTMQDWRIHTGVDIRSDVGTPVKAAGDGIVTKVFVDEMMGTTVVIQHANGIETVYSSLQSGELVDAGQEVARGDTIGGVGMTAPYEISEPPHLHFEIKKDGEFVNPFDYIN